MESGSIIEETEAPVYALYRPGDVALATLLGTPIAGAIVIGMNSARLGRLKEQWITLFVTVIATVLLAGALWNFPHPAGGISTLALFTMAAMYKLEQALHGKALARHKRRGGMHPSTWKAAGIGVFCLVAAYLAAVAYAFVGVVIEEFEWDSLEFNSNDVVYFAGDATEVDARALAAVLTDFDWFGDAGEDVYLERRDGSTTVSIVLGGDFQTSDTVDWVQTLGEALADAGLGRPLTIELCDDSGEVMNTIWVK